ncbi:GspH/FimT family pseudopilin [Halothiobacillus neapolitanus]|uniref:Type II secretion system protein H n=1 Tax=Halothiobacillus neapolitanus (strain ATCC 23641 / DSM 15147 / CIP 104769 / NCIMB 8539 / c2) TaxID=555778 RepID=D0KVW0_HALNC|nr:GspH/FimT family pseudopilin [Halothiobacillus neapolitanus]ACX94887.1 putative type-4 fimbrial pilin related signal peptide protein [Halothiobacillus neapolitanus c2]TDN60380.1 type IV fimbrial biogenesis protein FimT [Halothiobacillus neapolitanus]
MPNHFTEPGFTPPDSALGFTAIELMMTLIIAMILLAIAIPSFSRMKAQNHLATTANDFVSAFGAARQTAIVKGRPVTLCAGDQSGCFDTVDWSNGWLAFVDADKSGTLNAGEPVVFTGVARRGDVVVQGNTPVEKPIIFSPLGFASQPGGAFTAGTLRVCVPADIANNARDLVLAKSGRLRVEAKDLSGACPAP